MAIGYLVRSHTVLEGAYFANRLRRRSVQDLFAIVLKNLSLLATCWIKRRIIEELPLYQSDKLLQSPDTPIDTYSQSIVYSPDPLYDRNADQRDITERCARLPIK